MSVRESIEGNAVSTATDKVQQDLREFREYLVARDMAIRHDDGTITATVSGAALIRADLERDNAMRVGFVAEGPMSAIIDSSVEG